VAVAAMIALIAVLMPGVRIWAQTPPAAVIPGTPTGLPDHWYYAPPWTPPVTRHPMAAASMMLSGGENGPVLVSADGTSYASLPWKVGDSLVALAPSGRDVAWVTQGPNDPADPALDSKQVVVHRITLRDGHQKDAELPAGIRVDRLIWDGDRLVAVEPGDKTGLEWPAGGAVMRPTGDLPVSAADPIPLLDGSEPMACMIPVGCAPPTLSTGLRPGN